MCNGSWIVPLYVFSVVRDVSTERRLFKRRTKNLRMNILYQFVCDIRRPIALDSSISITTQSVGYSKYDFFRYMLHLQNHFEILIEISKLWNWNWKREIEIFSSTYLYK